MGIFQIAAGVFIGNKLSERRPPSSPEQLVSVLVFMISIALFTTLAFTLGFGKALLITAGVAVLITCGRISNAAQRKAQFAKWCKETDEAQAKAERAEAQRQFEATLPIGIPLPLATPLPSPSDEPDGQKPS